MSELTSKELVAELRSLALGREIPFVAWDAAARAADEIERLQLERDEAWCECDALKARYSSNEPPASAAADMIALCVEMEDWLRPEVVKEPDRSFFWRLVDANKRAKSRPTQPPPVALDPDAMGCAVLRVMEFADAYIDNYEMRGEDTSGRDTCYTPNDQEAMLIRDAINGLIADEDFVTAVGVEFNERQKLRASEGHCLECGCPSGEHYVKCSTATKIPAPAIACTECGETRGGHRPECSRA